MNDREKTLAILHDAAAGKVTARQMYDSLGAIADNSEDDDLVCVIEDALMELDLLGGAKREGKHSASDCAKMVLEEMKALP